MQFNRVLYLENSGVMKMMLETYYRILKHGPNGKLVKDTGLITSHSYVIQFLELIESFFGSTAKIATDIDGVESNLTKRPDQIQNMGRVDAGIGTDDYGIVVGINTGSSAEDNEDYVLDTPIAEGSAEGELSYQAVTFITPTVDAPNVDFDITRTFLNESGGTITVKEIGIICKNISDTKYHLLLRDVVSDEAVLAGYTLTVVYTLRTTV